MYRRILIMAIFIAGLLPMIAVAQSPGEIAGRTVYDVQTIGSTGRRIAIDSANGLHFAWTDRILNSQRFVYYNYRTSSGYWAFGETGISLGHGGYPQIDIFGEDRACIAYHYASTESLYCAIDAAPGGGFFDYYYPSNRWGGTYLMWPFVTIDNSGNIHLVATQAVQTAGELQQVGYTRSENGGYTWSSLAHVDTVMTISSIVVSSPVSNKVAIIYTHPIYGDSSQMLNDVYYIQSTDGTSWDWSGGKINVTNYGFPDSMFAYTDVDAIYDYDDNLHVFWNAAYYPPGSHNYYTSLLHYDTDSENISHLATVTEWDLTGCDLGAGTLPINKMSSSIDSVSSDIYVAYVSFTEGDCSWGEVANGDIFLSHSYDNGLIWSAPANITNSHTPGCNNGFCDNDRYPSLGKRASEGSVHLFYINEKLAGGNPPEVWGGSPMRYLSIPLDPNGADDAHTPTAFSLSQNYPNPFNAETRIDFELKNDAEIRLEIFNITGARVATLIDGELDAGPHAIVWDASKVTSGIYYYSLKVEDEEQIKRMVLIK